MSLLLRVNALRRRANEFNTRWRAVGFTVVAEDGEIVARCPRATLAELLADVHNIWLDLSNQWLLLHGKLKDRAGMTATEKDDKQDAKTPPLHRR